ncbi:hypothetical protein VNO80_29387 [Phaseolus coccineus]|uniref:Uncharacterized protein n=1 Tax=Phaseolus coccineus TaxID=3886 RepID=A0AAN9LDP8_PHACN
MFLILLTDLNVLYVTLPQPWKGLTDGSTGLLNYWNTEYEKPAPLMPPLPAPVVSALSLAPIPVAHTMQAGGMGPQHGQQLMQGTMRIIWVVEQETNITIIVTKICQQWVVGNQI